MVYHAQDLPTPAEVAYINAMRLAPGDKRWPYLLAHLYADASRLPEAIRTASYRSEREVLEKAAPILSP